jgi:hypothetical protein
MQLRPKTHRWWGTMFDDMVEPSRTIESSLEGIEGRLRNPHHNSHLSDWDENSGR